jgi:hypothetical protein
MIFSVDFFSDLAFLGGILLSFDSFRYNRNPSMKNTESIRRQDLKKNQPKISFFTSEKENPLSEDETDTGTTTEANEPIEVDDDVSHEASDQSKQNKYADPGYPRTMYNCMRHI